jgi:hypothetical protein
MVAQHAQALGRRSPLTAVPVAPASLLGLLGLGPDTERGTGRDGLRGVMCICRGCLGGLPSVLECSVCEGRGERGEG